MSTLKYVPVPLLPPAPPPPPSPAAPKLPPPPPIAPRPVVVASPAPVSAPVPVGYNVGAPRAVLLGNGAYQIFCPVKPTTRFYSDGTTLITVPMCQGVALAIIRTVLPPK